MSTFDLPSPALSSRGATRQSEGKPNKADKEGSWVWRWAEKRPDASGNTRIFCSVKGCSQRKGYALLKSSTSNIRNHLISDHKINATTPQEGSRLSGPLQSGFTNLGKRNSVQFSTDILQRQFCKVLVRHKLPYTLAESPHMLRLLKIAAAAPSPEEVKLCSNSTITRRVCGQARTFDTMNMNNDDICLHFSNIYCLDSFLIHVGAIFCCFCTLDYGLVH